MINFIGKHPNADPFRMAVMNSSAATDRLIDCISDKMRYGANPNEILSEACDECGVDLDELMDRDVARLKSVIEAKYRLYNRTL